MRISDWSSDVCSSDLAFEHVAAALDDLLFELERRDAERDQAADFAVAIEHDRLDAVAHENVGAAEAGRTGADDRDFLLGPAHLGHVRTPALLERFVGDVLFDAADRYRAEAVIERASTFTQPILRTDR